MYYQNPYGYRNKNKKNYLHKISKQLMAVLVLMLLLMLLKYTNSKGTEVINGKIKTMFYSDYTHSATQVFKNYSPDLMNILSRITDKYKTTDSIEGETLPVDVQVNGTN